MRANLRGVFETSYNRLGDLGELQESEPRQDVHSPVRLPTAAEPFSTTGALSGTVMQAASPAAGGEPFDQSAPVDQAPPARVFYESVHRGWVAAEAFCAPTAATDSADMSAAAAIVGNVLELLIWHFFPVSLQGPRTMGDDPRAAFGTRLAAISLGDPGRSTSPCA
jgi:hypothetical protein